MFLKLRKRLNTEKAIVLTNNIKKLYTQLASLINYLNNFIAIRENYKQKK